MHRIQTSLKIKEIGKYPQVVDIDVPTTVDDPLYTTNLLFKKVDRYLAPKPILGKKAKLTDLISAGAIGTELRLLISDKMKSILEKYSEGMQYFNTSVIYQGFEIEDYWLTNPYEFDYDLIDLEKSTIIVRETGSFNDKEIRINSLDDFLQLVYDEDRSKFPRITKLKLKPTDKQLAVLRAVSGGVGYYVSEKVKAELLNAGCTGIKFVGEDEKYP